MPLYNKHEIDNDTSLLIWKIDEEYDVLLSSVKLGKNSINRIEKFLSEKRKIEFLATRMLLQELDYSDLDLKYNNDGAPYLKDKFISISHTNEFAAIIISNKKVGIDVEKNRTQIFRIAHKFVNDEEKASFDTESLEVLSIIWNCKEAMFKLCDKTGIDFRKNLNITNINLGDRTINAELIFDDKKQALKGKIDIFNEHTLVYLMID